MKTTNNFEYNMNTNINAIDLLWKFVNQRPGLDFADYGDRYYYNKESREITKDLHDFRELFSYASLLSDNLNEALIKDLEQSSGRLTLENGHLSYCTGQYFPTEYRPAANRVLANIIWTELGKVYDNGNEIRKATKRRLSRRVNKYYFN